MLAASLPGWFPHLANSWKSIEPAAVTKETVDHLRVNLRGALSPDGDQEQTVLLSRQYNTRLFHHCHVASGLTAVLVSGLSDTVMDASTARGDILAVGSSFGSKEKHT